MNRDKEELLQSLFSDDRERAEGKIKQYRRQYPYDTDGMLLEGYFHLVQGELEQAGEALLQAFQHQPYDTDIYYLLGEWYAAENMPVEAMRFFAKALLLLMEYQEDYLFAEKEKCNARYEEINAWIDSFIENNLEREKMQELGQKCVQIKWESKKDYYLYQNIISDEDNIIGETCYFDGGKAYYAAHHNVVGSAMANNVINKNLELFKGEFLPQIFKGREITFGTNRSVLLPIASTGNSNILDFVYDTGEKTECCQKWKEHFNYYRIDKPVSIYGREEFILGKPVPIGTDFAPKKLVISLFLDGLSQQLLSEEGIWNIMPYTHEFFKKGMICKNAFTTSDWTYPSLASLVSGLEVPEHMMIHPEINISLPEETKTLYEYMSEAGYYTAMINGDWRSCEPYGYFRGIDRAVIQSAYAGMSAGNLVNDAIDHIEAFSDTNQYLWLCVADLHKVADGEDLPLAVQTEIPLEDRKFGADIINSVKQGFSLTKRKQYIELAKQVDLHLKQLYDYIESHYAEDEFVVTVFGDHGQTYLNKPEDFHLSRNHSNVGFMSRGGGIQGESEEYISTTSYPAIMCRLAGVDLDGTVLEDKLPVTYGGKNESDFVITETIHPGDPYMAAVHGKDGVFYYRTEEVLSQYGKLPQGEAQYQLYDASGKNVSDRQKCQELIKMLQNRIRYLYEY